MTKDKLSKILDVLPGKTQSEFRDDLWFLKKKFLTIIDEFDELKKITDKFEELKGTVEEVAESITTIPPPDARIPVLEKKVSSIKIHDIPSLEPLHKKIADLEDKFVGVVASFQENIMGQIPEPVKIPNLKPDLEALEEKI